MSAEKIKRPSFQFYPADWRKDTQLQTCSIEARGLWHEMLCLMHECEPYGHLTVNGQAMEPAKLARLVGMGPRECAAALTELEEAGVFSRTEWGAIYSRRMVRDEAIRNKRAAGGQDGAEHGQKGAQHGKKGGRPSNSNGGSETPLTENDKGSEKPPLYPPPSSSSSSSTSVTTPLPPSQPSAEGGNPPAKQRRRALKFPLPEAWAPNPTTLDWVNRYLAEHDLSENWAQQQHDLFIGKAKSNSWIYADWDQAYENFFRENGPGGRFYRPHDRRAA